MESLTFPNCLEKNNDFQIPSSFLIPAASIPFARRQTQPTNSEEFTKGAKGGKGSVRSRPPTPPAPLTPQLGAGRGFA